MGRGKKNYTKDDEKYRHAVINLSKKYDGKLKLYEKIYGFKAIEEYSKECRIVEELYKKKTCESKKKIIKDLNKVENYKFYICSFCNKRVPASIFLKIYTILVKTVPRFITLI